jgi:hypothetical protein
MAQNKMKSTDDMKSGEYPDRIEKKYYLGEFFGYGRKQQQSLRGY